MAVKLSERRIGLDIYLRGIVKARCGSENVYQPPANLRMKYTCITYELDKIRNRDADNGVYRQTVHYTVTVIATNPDREMTAAMSLLEKASHDRHFISDNLYHDVFSVWY